MENLEKLTKFEISKCFEDGADYFVLLSNEELSLIDVRIKVYHNVTWDQSKEGEIHFIIHSYEEAKTIRCDFCYDLPSFYKQLALGIDLIASYYKNSKNTVSFFTATKDLAEAIGKLDLWKLAIDNGLYVAERLLDHAEAEHEKSFSEDAYVCAVSRTGC